MALVLIVDDSELILQMLEMVVGQAGHRVVAASTWRRAEELYAQERPDVVVTDLSLPDVTDPLASLAALGDAPVVVVSGRPQAELDEIAAARGAAGAVSKDNGLPGIASLLPPLIARVTG